MKLLLLIIWMILYKQQKKKSHGSRKRRVEELIGDDLLEDDLDIDADEPALEKPEEASTLGLSSPRTRRPAGKPAKQHKFNAPTEEIQREVELGESITIQQLSQKMSVKATDVMKTLMSLGEMKTINESIDQETATLVVEEFGHRVKVLDVDGAVRRVKGGWVATGTPWDYDERRYRTLEEARRREQQAMLDYQAGEIYQSILDHPGLAEVTSVDFDVIEDHSFGAN